MQVVRILKWELTSLRLMEDSFANEKVMKNHFKHVTVPDFALHT